MDNKKTIRISYHRSNSFNCHWTWKAAPAIRISLPNLSLYIYYIYYILNSHSASEKKRDLDLSTMKKYSRTSSFPIGSACKRISSCPPRGETTCTYSLPFHRNKSRPPLTISTGPHRNPHCWGTNGGGPSFSVDDRAFSRRWSLGKIGRKRGSLCTAL